LDENSQAVAPITPEASPKAPPPSKKGPNKMLIMFAVAFVIVLVAAVIGIMLVSNGEASANVTSTPQQMVYKQSDFPAGWHESDATTDPPLRANTGWSFSGFNNSGPGDGFQPMAEVQCEVITYASVDAAQRVFSEMKENATALDVTTVPNQFDQCISYELDYGYFGNANIYIYQEKNVCGIISFASLYGYELSHGWIDDMIDLQDSRIV
jgi:hypothetical protein